MSPRALIKAEPTPFLKRRIGHFAALCNFSNMKKQYYDTNLDDFVPHSAAGLRNRNGGGSFLMDALGLIYINRIKA